MTSITDSHVIQTIPLDRALEYTVIQSWDDLMPDQASGLIHLEYQTGENGSTDFFKVWASISRGSWKLICEFWIRPLWSHATGLRFENGYHSEELAHNLEHVMRQEETFPKLPEQVGLIQIHPPTQEERKEADRWIKLDFNPRNPFLNQIVAA
jgi:hypothetical protein